MPAAADQHLERPHGPERHHYHESLIRNDDPRFFVFLKLQIIAKQTTSMFPGVALLCRKFARRRLRYRTGGPNLAMRMRVAGAHHFATILKNLYVTDARHRAQFRELRGPSANDFFNSWLLHAGKRQIMTRRKTHHPADSRLTFSYDEI